MSIFRTGLRDRSLSTRQLGRMGKRQPRLVSDQSGLVTFWTLGADGQLAQL